MFSKYVTRGKYLHRERRVIIQVNYETEKGIIIIKNNLGERYRNKRKETFLALKCRKEVTSII